MCSVIGYIGNKSCKPFILQSLARLEYRGYDSSGLVCIDSHSQKLLSVKSIGSLDNLLKRSEITNIDGYVGIGHTRWSTHGAITENNAHPHFDCHNKISIVHNGIIENFHALKTLLAASHRFVSETDSEIIAHVLEQSFMQTTVVNAVIVAVNQLQGAYAFTAIAEQYPDLLLAVRRGSPLCIGIGSNEMFVASDVLAFAGITNRVIFLPDHSFALISKTNMEIYDFFGNKLAVSEQIIDVIWNDDGKNGYEHYMLKEIYEQKNAIYATISSLQLNKTWLLAQPIFSECSIESLKSINLVGCGSSWHAARIAQFYFELVTVLPTRVMLASEFRYMPFFNEANSLYIAISQSGETADTLEAVRLIKTQNNPVLAISNVASSSIVRESDGNLLTKAGQEVSVASTKAFTTQLAALYWFAHFLACKKGIISQNEMDIAINDLFIAAEVLESSIAKYATVITEKIAPEYAQFNKFIFLGRHMSYPFAMEAALKLKEISYIFSQGYPAGELKHGPIALIDRDIPIVLCSTLDPIMYQKLISNAQEVKSRNGRLMVFAFEGQYELAMLADVYFEIPRVNPLLGALAMTGLMQFLAYSIAKALDCPIDRPRHLAKSVTVE